jgi:hypothetical protein
MSWVLPPTRPAAPRDASPGCGPAGRDPKPDPTFYAKVRALRAAMARVMSAWGDIDCISQSAHRAHHHPHPQGARLVCHVCHPPAGYRVATGGRA